MCYIILLYPEIRLKRAPQFHTVFKVIRVQAFQSQYLRCIGVGIDNRLTGHLKVYKVTVLCEENYFFCLGTQPSHLLSERNIRVCHPTSMLSTNKRPFGSA